MSTPAATPPVVKGWCPGAHRPMMSGDGLVVRVRPRLARLDRAQALGLCTLARRFGNGILDLTNRANLQIRGVRPDDHEALLLGLAGLDLLDADPALESRRNILVSPFWQPGDLTEGLARALLKTLPDLPDLPAKVGFAVDTGEAPLLAEASADFRFERSAKGLILRADGSAAGRPVSEATAMPALTEMAQWFDTRRSPEARRMTTVLAHHTLPEGWATTPPLAPARRPRPGIEGRWPLLGAAFGQIDAATLGAAIQDSDTQGMRVTPWRLFLLEEADAPDALPFITSASDPLLRAHACAGAPFCPQASVPTREVARQLADQVTGVLHVSGCAKGCAFPKEADVTLVGRDGAFDLVHDGTPWDAADEREVNPDTVADITEQE